MSIGRRIIWVLLMLSACQQPTSPSTSSRIGDDQVHAVAEPTNPVPAQQPVANPSLPVAAKPLLPPNGRRSCADELGQAAAQRLADRCRAVSPATRPPCHPSNSCALIENEIARGCSMLDDDAIGANCSALASDDGRAAAVIRRYYSAINARDFPTAYQEWGGDGEASGQSFESFRDGFAATRSVRVTIGSVGAIEGGAGSLDLDVPVRVDATLADGTRQAFTGTYSLRRVNDVGGAEPQQLQWHIMAARLRAVR